MTNTWYDLQNKSHRELLINTDLANGRTRADIHFSSTPYIRRFLWVFENKHCPDCTVRRSHIAYRTICNILNASRGVFGLCPYNGLFENEYCRYSPAIQS